MFNTEDLAKLANIETEIKALERKKQNLQADCEAVKNETIKAQREAEQAISLRESQNSQNLNLRKQFLDEQEKSLREKESTLNKREGELSIIEKEIQNLKISKEELSKERQDVDILRKNFQEEKDSTRIESEMISNALRERDEALSAKELECHRKSNELSQKIMIYDSAVKDRENLNKEIEEFQKRKESEDNKINALRTELNSKKEEAEATIKNTNERLAKLEEEYKKKMKG